jgi:hypothetical protein
VSSWRGTCRGQQPQQAGQQVTGCFNKCGQRVLDSATTLVFLLLTRRRHCLQVDLPWAPW